MCLRWITSFWRHHGCYKYMFRIAEEYTKTIKTNPDEKYFFILAKIDFQNFEFFEIFKNQNFEKKNRNNQNSPKSKISKLCWHFRFLEISIFQICFLKILIFENFKKIRKFENPFSPRWKHNFRPDLFLLSWYILPHS